MHSFLLLNPSARRGGGSWGGGRWCSLGRGRAGGWRPALSPPCARCNLCLRALGVGGSPAPRAAMPLQGFKGSALGAPGGCEELASTWDVPPSPAPGRSEVRPQGCVEGHPGLPGQTAPCAKKLNPLLQRRGGGASHLPLIKEAFILLGNGFDVL